MRARIRRHEHHHVEKRVATTHNLHYTRRPAYAGLLSFYNIPSDTKVNEGPVVRRIALIE